MPARRSHLALVTALSVAALPLPAEGAGPRQARQRRADPPAHRVAVKIGRAQLTGHAPRRAAPTITSRPAARTRDPAARHHSAARPGRRDPSRATRGGSTPNGHVAHAAASLGLRIVDFQFTPASITAHVGDTLTWTNSGPSPHTATARDGSFDTGLLQKGQSAAHTFTHAGTFSYYCTVHPFMHGTVVVLAGASTTGSSSPAAAGSPATAAGSPPTAAGSPASAGGPGTLPLTGIDLSFVALLGLLLGVAGISLRRALR